ncbi:MAG: hypothetical protein AB1742_04840 [bacterium]
MSRLKEFCRGGIPWAVAAVLCIGAAGCGGKGGGQRQAAAPPESVQRAAAPLRATVEGGRAVEGAEAAGAEGAEKPETKEDRKKKLIKDTGFDMINPNFSKKTGREDPFKPVPISMAPIDWVKRVAPERFRLVGTAKGQFGTFALVEMGTESVVVEEGETLKGDSVVKEIRSTEVHLEKEGKTTVLGMRVRRRVAPQKPEEMQEGKIPNLNDYYRDYLEQKYGERAPEFGEEAAPQPKDFMDYLKEKETEEKKKGG